MIDIIVFIGCVLCGYCIGKYIEKCIAVKGLFYQDVRRYTVGLRENVTGRQLELDKFNGEFTQNCSAAFADYLTNGKCKCKLSKNQKKNLLDFFCFLDCVSSVQLSEHLDYYGKILEDDCRQVTEKEASRAGVYGKLGMLLGAMLGIMLM